jgi:hypothetical protein
LGPTTPSRDVATKFYTSYLLSNFWIYPRCPVPQLLSLFKSHPFSHGLVQTPPFSSLTHILLTHGNEVQK